MVLPNSSMARLVGVHPDLVRVVIRAAEFCPPEIGFIVTEGVRSEARQVELVTAGASQTLRSRHITGHAVDLAATVGAEVRWDWPLYDRLAGLMFRAADLERVPIEWGGRWARLKDGPHFQLPWREFPVQHIA